MSEFLFWLGFFTVLYAYAGYPLALWVISKFAERPVKKGHYEPRVSIILSAFNEERFIEAKLTNLLQADYPDYKIEIIVGSDGGRDDTDAIVSKFDSERVRFFRFVKNLGKPHVLNSLMREAHGTVVVFTDARQEFPAHSIRELVENFHDPDVGCVSGELLFRRRADGSIGQGMGAYWTYEKFLRKTESKIGSMLGATGAIYAIRRQFFVPLPANTLADDMYVPLSIIQKGYRAVFDSKAIAYDEVSSTSRQEMIRKIRTLAGNWQIFRNMPQLLNPAQSTVAIQLISHKLLRLMVPLCIVVMFLSNLMLMDQTFYQGVMIAQLLFYGFAFWEWRGEKKKIKGKKGIGYLPYTFCVLNYAAFKSIFYYLSKGKLGTWTKAYE
ncbi:glycosyltransferase family 2 protein [Omnitrophica bacterium]|nr:glycosyltransferase family 2 protein [Candidatus Omnitrophota bacterium]